VSSVALVSAYETMLLSFGCCFTRPTAANFATVIVGWTLCLGRPTVVRIVASLVFGATRHLSTYHRFFSTARWSPDDLWRVFLVHVVVPNLVPEGPIAIAADDTTCEKYGRRVAYAGRYRDAVRSNPAQLVVHWAHNWVILTMLYRSPLWPLRVIAIPVMARLYRKAEQCDQAHPFGTRAQLVVGMMRELADWLPGREFEVVADGAYPSEELLAELPARASFTSRLRADATLFGLPPAARRRRMGRPRRKGAPLPKLAAIARRRTGWVRRVLVLYGRRRRRELYEFTALWWHVAKGRPLKVVIVRDPRGREKDDYFFTTDTAMDAGHLVELFAARWGIEEAIREAKQLVGFDDVQGWRAETVERQAPLALLVLGLAKVWYLVHVAPREHARGFPSTASMLTRLRMSYWQQRLSQLQAPRRETQKLAKALGSALAAAA